MFFVTFGAMSFVMVLLAVGLLIKKKPLQPSCGGVARLATLQDGIDSPVECEYCGAKIGDPCLSEDG